MAYHPSPMTFWHLVGDITVLLGVAVLAGIVLEKFRVSAVVGYLLAGMLVGPGVLDWVTSDEEVIGDMAEIGVALLLFTIGLEISPRRLRSLAGRSLLLGLLQIIVTGSVAWAIALLMGAEQKAAIVIGTKVAMSSTATVARVLQDRSELDSPHGRVAFGVLVLQDLALVPLLLLVSLLGDAGGESVAASLGGATVRLMGLLATIFLVGVFVLPRVLGARAIRRSADLPIVLGVVTCFAAMILAHSLGLSPALGAFVAGLILAGSPFSAQVRADLAPLRSVFLTLFFVSIGMLADVPWLLVEEHWLLVLGVAAAIIAGKAAIAWVAGLVCRLPRRVAIGSGLCLAQIGEFSFVIGSMALAEKIIDDDAFQLFVSASLLTLLAAPLLVGRARPIARWIDSFLGGTAPEVKEQEEDRISAMRDHAIVLGFGPAGSHVITALEDACIPIVVIDMSRRGVDRAHAIGLAAVLGDATRREHLDHAGVSNARLLVSTLPDHRASAMAIGQARAMAPGITVVARARYAMHAAALAKAGADIVIDEEDRVGDALGASALRQLGQ